MSDANMSAQAKANAEAAEAYKKNLGKKFSDQSRMATVLEYHPMHNFKGVARQCFLVNFGNPNVSEFRPCKEFLETFSPASDDAAPVSENNLPH